MAIAAGVYELTPLKHHFRRRRESARSGLAAWPASWSDYQSTVGSYAFQAILAIARANHADIALDDADALDGSRRTLIEEACSDETLMFRVQRDDVRAFEILFDRHWSAVFRLAMRFLDDRGLAADVAQEAFTALWLNRDQYRPHRGRLKWWLLSIVRNRAIDLQRRSRDDVPRSAPLFELTAALDCTEEEVLAGDERRELARLVAHLPSEQRAVIELAFYSGLSHAEITERLGVPLGTIKGRIRSALDRLRVALPHDGPHSATR